MTLLLSGAPAADRASEMELFGRFVGRWRTHIVQYPIGGAPREAEGEWEFSYALEGRAVIDVWQVPPRAMTLAGTATRECALNVRVYDPVQRVWRFTFHGPLSRTSINMTACQVGDEIVQQGTDGSGEFRWIFGPVGERSFTWRAERQDQAQGTWRVEQIVAAVRVSESAGTKGRSAETPDLSSALLADRPALEREDGARTFDRLIGHWSAEYRHFEGQRLTEHYTGSVTFGWILEGEAIQDVWIGDAGPGRLRSLGTSLRYWDRKRRQWDVHFFVPQEGLVVRMQGGDEGGDIVLLGRRDDGRWRRWSLRNIQHDRFEWIGEFGDPDTDQWERVAHYLMRRARGP